MGWFRGFVLPMLGVGFIFAIFWFWFVERMGSVSKPAELYLPTPQELAALKQAALEKQQGALPPTPTPGSPASALSKPAPELPKAPAPSPIPTGRAVFNLGQEPPKAPVKPPQV